MPETSASTAIDGAPETRSQSRRRWSLFLGTAGLIVLLDQLSKTWVDATFEVASRRVAAGEPGGPTEVIGGLARIAKTYNDGAIFGLFDTAAPILAIVTLFIVVGIGWYEWRHGVAMGPLVTVGLALLLGGAVGNLIDRFRFGHVIDFIDLGLGTSRWYAFNISDAAVFIGILVLFAAALIGDRAMPGRHRQKVVPADENAAGSTAPPTRMV